MGDAASPYDRGANIVDQLVLDQILGIPDAVEYFPHGQRRNGVLADQLERFLILGRRHVFKPEQLERLQHPAQIGRLLRGIAMMAVVQKMMIEAIGIAQLFKQFRHVIQGLARVPSSLARQGGIGRLIIKFAAPHAIGILDSRHAGLRADRLVPHVDIVADGIHRLCDIAAIGVTINHDAVTASTTQ